MLRCCCGDWSLLPPGERLGISLAVATALSFYGAFVLGLITGRETVFGLSVLRAVHVSPAPGRDIRRGLFLAAVLQQLISGLLVGTVTAWLLPESALWWRAPLLWAASSLCCMIGYACALLALVGWVRAHSRSLAVMWGVAMMIGASIVIVLIFLVIVAPPVVAVVAVFRAEWRWVAIGAVAIGGVTPFPSVFVPFRTAERSGDWYREAFLNMQEMGDARRRLRASRWPRVLPGAAGAFQARLWRERELNWFTWVRVALLVIALGFFSIRDRMVNAAGVFPAPGLTLLLGLTLTLGSFGELPPVMGSSDGPNIGLAMVAGVRAGKVIIGKWLACLPLALLSMAVTWVGSVLVGKPDLLLSLAAGFIVLSYNAVVLAGGMTDLEPHAEVTERDVPEILRTALEQVPRKPGKFMGSLGAVLFTVLTGWLCARYPADALPIAAGGDALAHLTLVPAFRRIVRMGM